ncbi:hypothetical protein CLM62_03845 [Streptomyces sp. SA15]|uniref:hypothetical protein n=1 Tax=Streptomyces sp. SA15 TaxID=934019 RepID=UPI000BAEECA0|nr:hypothetical protein [Streptomyces sp. SA15]PAZ17132.1 hypothetical protein CLM62_03845 [Streptomyces sp. SA15]
MIEHVSQETKLQYERTAEEVRKTLRLVGIPLVDRTGNSGAHVYIDTFLDAGSAGGSEGVYVEWLSSAELMAKVDDCAARGDYENPVLPFADVVLDAMRMMLRDVLEGAGWRTSLDDVGVHEEGLRVFGRSGPVPGLD